MSKEIELKVLDPREFNFKRYRKTIRKRFLNYQRVLRFHLDKDHLNLYQESVDKILNVLFETLSDSETFRNRNCYFLFSIMEEHFSVLENMRSRISTLHKDLLDAAYKSVIQVNEELCNKLIKNKKEPVTGDQIELALKEKQNELPR